MIMAIRANVALYFELKSQLAGMRPLLKYLSCRMVLSACLSQRFLLDVSIFDPDARFEVLNLLIVVEMAVRSSYWQHAALVSDYPAPISLCVSKQKVDRAVAFRYRCWRLRGGSFSTRTTACSHQSVRRGHGPSTHQ